jgi:Rrf2 family protein
MTLVENEGGEPIAIRELAERNDVPKPFLEHILLEMKQRGWVRSTPGKYGGYVLGISADRLTLGQVVRFFDGALAPIACVSVSHHEACSQENRCRFRRVLLRVRNETARLMDGVTLRSILLDAPVMPEELRMEEALIDGSGI